MLLASPCKKKKTCRKQTNKAQLDLGAWHLHNPSVLQKSSGAIFFSDSTASRCFNLRVKNRPLFGHGRTTSLQTWTKKQTKHIYFSDEQVSTKNCFQPLICNAQCYIDSIKLMCTDIVTPPLAELHLWNQRACRCQSCSRCDGPVAGTDWTSMPPVCKEGVCFFGGGSC